MESNEWCEQLFYQIFFKTTEGLYTYKCIVTNIMLELNEDYQIRYTAYEKNPENYIDTENSNFV